MAGNTTLFDEIRSKAAYKQTVAQELVLDRKRMALEMLNPVWQSDASLRQDIYGAEVKPAHETLGSKFSKLHSSYAWQPGVSQPGVSQFVALADVKTYHDEWRDALLSLLKKAFRVGNPALSYEEGAKFHAFGFHYRACPVSPKALEACWKTKEAFGVEVEGMQFVFLELFRVH